MYNSIQFTPLNGLTSEEQTRLLQLMVQKVVLGEDTLKISVFPLGNSGNPLEYLLKHPEFAESDNKAGFIRRSLQLLDV